jgi:hypothetical protein
MPFSSFEGKNMRIPRFWARGSFTDTDRDGKKHTFSVLGWSFESLAGARDFAIERARKILQSFMSGKKLDRYEYLEHPLKEEIIDTVEIDGRETALITRNRYGAMVLNSASAAFADIDLPKVKANGFFDAILLAFSKARRKEREKALLDTALQVLRDWLDNNPGHSFRVYRTRAGLRLLFTDKLYEPTSEETLTILKMLGSDPLYRRLTEKQQCFRARLTPKPWRCDCLTPPYRYPWNDENEKRQYRQWEDQYRQKCRGYKACELIEEFGRTSDNKEIDAIIRLHDRHACGESMLKLA